MLDKTDPRLTAFVLNELSDSDRAEIQQAVAASPQLQQAVAEIRNTVSLIESEFNSQPPVELGSKQHAEIERAIDDGKLDVSVPLQSRTSRRYAWGIVAIAAAIALLITPLVWTQYFANNERPALSMAPSADKSTRQRQQDQGQMRQHDLQSDLREMPSAALGGDSSMGLVDNSESMTDGAVANPRPVAPPGSLGGGGGGGGGGFGGGDHPDPDGFHPFQDNGLDAGGEDRTTDNRFYGDFAAQGQPGDTASRGLGSAMGELSGDGDEGKSNGDLVVRDASLLPGSGQGGRRFGDDDETDEKKDAQADRGRDDHPAETDDLRFETGKAVEPVDGKSDEWFLAVNESRPVEKFRKERRSRVVQTAEGPKTQMFEVEVPVTEEVTESYYRLSESKTREIAQQLAQRIDPEHKRPIQVLSDENAKEVGAIILGGKDGQLTEVQKAIEDLLRVAEQQGNEIKVDERKILEQIQGELEERNKKIREQKTWRRVQATPNTSRLMIGEKDELPMNGMQVNVQIEGFRARVLIDSFFYNDRNRQLEGNFKIRLPDDASLYYFAFGQSVYEYTPNGKLSQDEFLDDGRRFVSLRARDVRRIRQDSWQNVKEARMVPREQAAFAYRETVRRKVDPALVEWSGGGIFNARVFPLMPHKMHRIVIGYDVDLTATDDGLAYQLELPEQTGECVVNVNVAELEDAKYEVSPSIDATQSDGLAISPEQRRELDRLETQLSQDIRRLGKTHPQVTALAEQIQKLRMSLVASQDTDTSWLNYRFVNPEQQTIRLAIEGKSTFVLRSNNTDEGNFFATRFKVDLPDEKNENVDSRAIFLVDTSLSSQPDKFNVWLKMLEATLNNNRGQLNEFAVVFFNVESYFWKDEYTANTSENVQKLLDDCNRLSLEGATDLYGAVQRVTMADWTRQGGSPALFLLSDGNANWGETNLRLIHRLFDDSDLGSLFAYQTGMTGTSISALRFLAGKTGGAVFSIANEVEIAKASSAHRARPWQIKNISVSGGRDLLTAGRVRWVYPGQLVTLVGRASDDPTDIGAITMKLTQGDREIDLQVKTDGQAKSELAGRLFGQVAVGQLESLGQQLFDVSAAYARHFRITGQSCSLLMLESEADYQRFNIVPQDDLIVVNSRQVSRLVADVLDKSAAEIADPKAQLLTWVRRLESMQGMNFKIPTALSLALDEIQVEPISSQLNCKLRNRNDLPEDFREILQRDRLDYGAITRESKRRLAESSDDAIKAISSLIENNPGDVVLARDVAFTAMELQHPAQAYHLLRRVAEMRPFEATIYTAIGKCLAQLGQADMAVVYYEIALGAQFQDRGEDFRRITATEYSHLLRTIQSGNVNTSIRDYAMARLNSLTRTYNLAPADVLVTMMWNTDQTDVDLHVLEPTGEECSYQHTRTRSGGSITRDITTGFGPEMYTLPSAPQGKYSISANYFSSDANRTGLRGKIYVTIYRNFGSDNESVTRKTVNVSDVGQKQNVDTFSVK